MKLTIERDALFKALSRVSGVVTKNASIPILANLLLDADADILSITGSDLDMEAQALTPATVQAGGQVTAPSTILHDIVRNLPPGGEVLLELTAKNRLKVICGRMHAELPLLPAADFPRFPGSVEGEVGGMVNAAQLKRLLEKTRFAIGADDGKPMLKGVWLHYVEPETEGGEALLRAVATNSHQMGWADMPAPPDFDGFPGCLVPRKSVEEMIRQLDGVPEVQLIGAPARLRLETGTSAITTKLLDQQYPDYRRAFAARPSTVIRADAVQLALALRRSDILADDKYRTLRLELADARLSLAVRSNMAGGTLDEALDVEHLDGAETIEAAVNAKEFRETIAQIDGDFAELHIPGNGLPIAIFDSADKRVRYAQAPHKG